MCGLVVESGEPRETMHFALLLGYGASAVNPYLALDRWPRVAAGELGAETAEEAQRALRQGGRQGPAEGDLEDGHLDHPVATAARRSSRPSGLGRRRRPLLHGHHLARRRPRAARHRRTRWPSATSARRAGGELDPGGEYQQRLRGEHHDWNPESIVRLQRAVRDDDHRATRPSREAVDERERGSRHAARPAGARARRASRVPLEEVEPSSEIVKRFATGAMGSARSRRRRTRRWPSRMNRLGARSNTGEGGEDAARSEPDPNGDLRRSAIKQVASARFGVTAAYLVDADQLQIKMAQGAKPGEGGQLPGHKVDDEIARLRHSTPGVGLISPPPHHDIYSIEDLAQLIHDLKASTRRPRSRSSSWPRPASARSPRASPRPRPSTSSSPATTAAPAPRPLSSIKHAGLPWELGIAEAHQVLVMNELRGRVRLQVDGGLRTGRDVVIGALLGAEEFGFSTAPLIAAGCVMMRVCHLNTCPVGIATQDPELRRRFTGTPEHVVRYFLFVAEQVRELMAQPRACARFDELVGRTDLLRQAPSTSGRGCATRPRAAARAGRRARRARRGCAWSPGPRPRHALDNELIAAAGAGAGAGRAGAASSARVRNTDRSLGAMLAGEIARRRPATALPDGTIHLLLRGHRRAELRRVGAARADARPRGAVQRLRRQGPVRRRASIVRPPADARLRRRGQRRRRQHRAVRRDRRRGLLAAAPASASACATPARARWSRASATTAAST